MAPSVSRALVAIERVLCAINLTLYLASGGDDRVSDGFNKDIAGNGRDFGRRVAEPASV